MPSRATPQVRGAGSDEELQAASALARAALLVPSDAKVVPVSVRAVPRP